MKIGRLLGLFLLLWKGLGVDGEETMSIFIHDMMKILHLISPTIVYDTDEAPDICYTHEWVLCLSSANKEWTTKPERDPKQIPNDQAGEKLLTKGMHTYI